MPERIRKIQVRVSMVESGCLSVKRATDHAKIKITTVLMAVAKLEFTWATPTFASTAVSPAKNAESKAQINQLIWVRDPGLIGGSVFILRMPWPLPIVNGIRPQRSETL